MQSTELLTKLKKLGKPKTVEIYRRHGAQGEVWGVSFADLTALRKQIKTDHPLAQALWKSGALDAQTLALMIADPAALTAAEAEKWLAESKADVLLGYVAQLVARTSFAKEKMESWTKSKEDFPRTTGYTLLAALMGAEQISDADARRHLATIEKTIHSSPNRSRLAMNSVVIAMGIHKPAFEKEAIAAARRIGPINVDHGDTGCKTPDAEAYIKKALARKKK
jgi:3-methyladenine DNA glycosylase AlkD